MWDKSSLETVGVFSEIEISDVKYQEFFKKYGSALVADVAYSLKNRELDMKGEKFCLQGEYYHDPRNQLVIRYERDSKVLFYLYFLELRTLFTMQIVPSFLTLKNIVEFMTEGQVGYAAFSSSAPNFLTNPVLAGYKFEKGSCIQINHDQIDETTLERLSKKSYRYWILRERIVKQFSKNIVLPVGSPCIL